MRKRTWSVAVAALAITLAAGPATAASAAVTTELPEGESLYVVECESGTGGFGTVDPATAAVTLIGTGSNDPNVTCAGMAAFNPVNGLGYWSSWDIDGDLFSVDLTTGEHTFIGSVRYADDSAPSFWLEHMAIGPDGTAYGIANDDVGTVSFVRIDLDTAIATPIETPAEALDFDEVGDYTWWSFAYNPADGQFYAISDATDHLYRVDVASGALTDLGAHGDGWAWYGISFDSNGTMWGVCTGTTTQSCVVTQSTVADWTTAGASQESAATTVDGAGWFTEAQFIDYTVTAEEPVDEQPEEEQNDTVTDAPELAATGSDPLVVGSLVGAALALLSAGVLVTLRARGQRQQG